jgi:hypothetical protein
VTAVSGNRDSLQVTPFMLSAARVFAADVVEQIHGELNAANAADAQAAAAARSFLFPPASREDDQR